MYSLITAAKESSLSYLFLVKKIIIRHNCQRVFRVFILFFLHNIFGFFYTTFIFLYIEKKEKITLLWEQSRRAGTEAMANVEDRNVGTAWNFGTSWVGKGTWKDWDSLCIDSWSRACSFWISCDHYVKFHCHFDFDWWFFNYNKFVFLESLLHSKDFIPR